jgi:hypothetical protein
MKNTPKTKTAKEWLKHLPPHLRELIRESRNKYWKEDKGSWNAEYSSLLEMIWSSEEGNFYTHRQEPIWDELYTRHDAGEFKYPWKDPEPTEQELVNTPINEDMVHYKRKEKALSLESEPFKVGQEVELAGVPGKIQSIDSEEQLQVEWDNGTYNILSKDNPLRAVLKKVIPSPQVVKEKYPIDSRWMMEFKVTKHTDDDEYPIHFLNDMGITVSFHLLDLHNLKPLKP